MDEPSIHGGYDRVCQREQLLAEVTMWRERAERAEAENRKLRDAWPQNIHHTVRRCGYGWELYDNAGTKQILGTYDECINAAAGITPADVEG
jgi:hypothetical protein